jgi:hypothetical protein
MGVSHDEVPMAHNGFSSSLDGSAVDGYELPDDVIIAHDHPGRFSPVTHVLGRGPYRGKGKQMTSFTDLGPPVHDHV